jgi:DNA-directed RNA polymerase specialized sigma24 family protein
MIVSANMTTIEHPDMQLVNASRAGDRDAFAQIVARYQSLVCSVAYSGTGSLSLSEDVAQDTFVAAWKQLGELREPEKLCAWLCGIARNITRNTLRRLGSEPVQSAENLERRRKGSARAYVQNSRKTFVGRGRFGRGMRRCKPTRCQKISMRLGRSPRRIT